LLDRLVGGDLPIVSFGRPFRYEKDVSWVSVDDHAAVGQIIAYLTSRGHRSIATITGPLNLSGGWWRLEGYREALGPRFRESLVAYGDWSFESGRVGTRDLLERHPELDAIFVASDLMAGGAIAELRRAGRRVPHDVAVAGFDDSKAAISTEPPLTTMRHPLAQLACEAVRMLFALIDGQQDGAQHVMLPAELIIRESA
jgi:DNA-binding LacI/PurR family transcriptional regulator